ncbi:MAG: ATP-binding protein [Melioribacteraceae bacterium]|nr:ATP-binding protein [Melioribacteraceae bacterium]
MKTKLNISNNELIIYSSTSNLAEVRSFVEMHGKEVGLDKKVIAHITLAVDEACTNIIEHAYNNSPNEKIKLKIKTVINKFSITITDSGHHFDPSLIEEPDIEKTQKMKKGGGLGMFLMKKLMDEVKYIAKKNGNELILIKYFN